MSMEVELELRFPDRPSRTFKARRWMGLWWSWHGVRRELLDLTDHWEKISGWEGEPFSSKNTDAGAVKVHMDDGSTVNASLEGVPMQDFVKKMEEISDERDKR